MAQKLLTEEQLKGIEDKANNGNVIYSDIWLLLGHIAELNRRYNCMHHWEYHYERGFVCGKCDLERNKRT